MIRSGFFIFCLIIAFFFLGWGVAAYAQKKGQAYADSLSEELAAKYKKHDTVRANLLNHLADAYGYIHPRKAMEYGEKALRLAQELNWDKGVAMSCNSLGSYCWEFSSDSIEIYSRKAIEINRKLYDKDIEAIAALNLGRLYFVRDISKSREYFLQTLKLSRETDDRLTMARALMWLSRHCDIDGEFDKSAGYWQEAATIASRLNNKLLEAEMMGFKESFYVSRGENAKALGSLDSSLAICRKYGFKEVEAMNLMSKGNVYYILSDYPTAIGYLQQAQTITDELGIHNTKTCVLLLLGRIYASLSDYPKAIGYYKNSRELARKIGDKTLEAVSVNNIGDAYEQIGNYTQAMDYYKASLELCKKLQKDGDIGFELANIGHIHLLLKDYINAYTLLQQALRIARETKDTYTMGFILGCLAQFHIAAPDSLLLRKNIRPSERYGKALQLADSSRIIASESGSVETMAGTWKLLSEIHQKQKHPDKALEAYQNYILLRDSTTGIEVKNQITRKQMQFEFDKKVLSDSLHHAGEKRLADLKLQKQKSFTYSGLAGVATLLLFSVFVFKSYTTQKKTNVLLSAEKQKSERLLLNILPHEVAEELKEKGYAEAQQFDKVTVLFTDFVNFTQTSEQLSPQALVQELHECFTTFDYIIGRHGLEKIKTVGDAYMAVCGLPLSDPRHAQKTVQAALEIRDFIEKRKEAKKVFDIRIGIHSGSVVAGIVGVKKFAYDIWGDTVNTAARMESSSEPAKVNISETTFELVKDEFNCIYRGEIEAKNKGMMKMYFVNG